MEREGVIVIIDDDEDYSCLMQTALREASVINPIKVIQDSAAALAYLKGAIARGISKETPALVLLDLRMPKVSGLEVLDRIRDEPGLARVPIAVFTGVESSEEQSQAVASGASSLRVKPFTYRELVETARSLHEEYLVLHGLEQKAA